MDQKQEITVVLADDHGIVREGIAGLCAEQGLRVVGQCGDGVSAVEMVLNLKPDFAILDVWMPGVTGVEAIRKLRAAGCNSKLMILSVCSEENTVQEALRAGADAYLLKDGPSRHLSEAIAFVRDGGVWISPLLRGAGLFTRGERSHAEDPLALLSPREMEVYKYLVDGLRAKDIADLLGVSPKTVETYRASLMRRLNVHDFIAGVPPQLIHPQRGKPQPYISTRGVPPPRSVIIAGPSEVDRERVADLCNYTRGHEEINAGQKLCLIGECADGRSAAAMILNLKPDIAILDLRMPGMGIDVIRKLRAAGCTTKLIVFSLIREEATVRETLWAGADAYLLDEEDGPCRHLLDAINCVLAGDKFVSPLLRRKRPDNQGQTQ